jgi:hypothetical protein
VFGGKGYSWGEGGGLGCNLYFLEMLEKIQLKKTRELVFKVIILTFVEKFWGPGKKNNSKTFFAYLFSAFCIIS